MTFIQCEMINDISRLSRKETEITEITNRAMDGEINFKEALRQVVALLEGVRFSDLERLILNISYTTGVERLVYIVKTLGYQIRIVSDGFTRIIDHIKQRFDVDYRFANTLEVKNGELTGHIIRRNPRWSSKNMLSFGKLLSNRIFIQNKLLQSVIVATILKCYPVPV